MRYLIVLSAALAAFTVAASAVASPSVRVTIRHQARGCHSWAIGNGAYRAAQTLAAKTGTTVTFTNNDMMPQTLVQTAGPRLSLHAPRLAHMGASTRVTFTKPGTYRFTTKAGEDYMSGVKTIGADNVLTLVVHVR